jgi:diguanylate cyclase (GGDEF)-like protein
MLAAGAALAFLFLLWASAGVRHDAREAASRAVRVAQLAGTIRHLDEWLTMSARMMVSSGDPRWAERYGQAEPVLEAAINEAMALAPAEVRERLNATTNEANLRLVEIERQALELTAAGEAEQAVRLLDGSEYERLKEVYARGLEEFMLRLELVARGQAEALDRRAWQEAIAIALVGVAMLACFALAGRARLRGALDATRRAAGTDALTGLLNRRGFTERLDGALALHAAGARDADTIIVLLIDLDRFKLVNDNHGHPMGDQLLVRVAERIRRHVRADTHVARLGGDEFALALELPQDADDAPEAVATVLATRLVAALSQPFVLTGDIEVTIGASTGFAIAPADGQDAAALMRAADVAMYHAKHAGGARAQRFEPELDAIARDRAAMEAELRLALRAGEVRPHFQPLVSIENPARLIGFEALARWHHPQRGHVPPASFIPIAEAAGLMAQLTDTVMTEACRTAAGWAAPLTVSVNVAPTLVQSQSLVTMVRQALSRSGLAPERLELELTESALIADLDAARTVLNQIAGVGVRLALDDFGTGYSGLSRIGALRVNTLKIDQSFIRCMSRNAHSRKIVAAVLGLGSSLGLVTVAEGVEDAGTAALLQGMGCDVAQGWLFGKPVPSDVASSLAAQSIWDAREAESRAAA